MTLILALSFATTDMPEHRSVPLAGASLQEQPALAAAQDEEDDDEFAFIKEGEKAAKEKSEEQITGDDFDMEDDDGEFADFQVGPSRTENRAPQPTSKGALPNIIGADKLTNAYAPAVVSPGAGVVLVEMPVLVAHNPSDFDGRAFWIVTEIYADGMKVGTSRSEVRRETLASAGPSFVFVKVQVPVPSQSGELELKVGRATAAGGPAQPLYSRKVSYKTQ